MIFAGIDVSSYKLDLCGSSKATYENTPKGHQQIIQSLTRGGRKARVCLEATGNYGLDLALALDRAEGIEVMVVNPRAGHHFARAMMKRSKTDPVDAEVLREYARRMDFVPWAAPSREHLELRALARRSLALNEMMSQEKNRLHAAQSTEELAFIRNDIEVNIRHFERRLAALDKKIERLIDASARLQSAIAHLTSIKGIALTSAVRIYAELCILPSDMSARQWVAHAGLDPRRVQSGKLIGKTRISKVGNKYLRTALYMPTLTAVRFDSHIKAFYEKLVDNGKMKAQARVAVMRKLLHAIHGMLRHDADFDGRKFYAMPENA